ncbi:MAG: STAS domain-containing protein [Bdellovibrionales bacterium]
MEARFRKDGDIHIVHIYGRLTYEGVDSFHKVCEQLLDEKVVFNFDDLSFVGSIGIQGFFQAIRNLESRTKVNPRLCNLSVEFQKLLDSLGLNNVMQFDSEFQALKSFTSAANHSQAMFVQEAAIGSTYSPSPGSFSEEPIGRAYVGGRAEADISEKVVYPIKINGIGLANKED